MNPLWAVVFLQCTTIVVLIVLLSILGPALKMIGEVLEELGKELLKK